MKKKLISILLVLSFVISASVFVGCADLTSPNPITQDKFEYAANRLDAAIIDYNGGFVVWFSNTAYSKFIEFNSGDEAIQYFNNEANYWTGGAGTFVEVNLNGYQMRRISTARRRYVYRDFSLYGRRYRERDNNGNYIRRDADRDYYVRIYRVGNVVVYAEGLLAERQVVDKFIDLIIIR